MCSSNVFYGGLFMTSGQPSLSISISDSLYLKPSSANLNKLGSLGCMCLTTASFSSTNFDDGDTEDFSSLHYMIVGSFKSLINSRGIKIKQEDEEPNAKKQCVEIQDLLNS